MEFLKEWGHLLAPQGGFGRDGLWQVLVVATTLLVTSKLINRTPQAPTETCGALHWLKQNLSFIIFWLIISLLFLVLSDQGTDVTVFRFFSLLGTCWITIGVLTSLLREPFWARSVAVFGYLLSGLFGLDLVEDSVALLDGLKFNFGSFSVTAWGVLAGILAFAFSLWISLAIARLAEVRIQSIPNLSPSLRVLLAKFVRIAFIAIASMVAISSMGVDLSTLTVLGGAIGIGLGFGLQKVVSNLVSGMILLMDNSIKPGDVIEIEGTYGWINNLRARYASVITRDGTEHLIPNEDLITQKVVNWSFTDNLVRIKVPVGVSYNSDPHQCIQLVLEAATSVERVLTHPAPTCPLRGFGDSSVDLELRFWISDPAAGVANVQSQVLLKIWDSFKANNIEIPYPQRDLHIRSSEIIAVQRSHPDPD
ncbi:MAG: small-conductance mechanosensitive channel [Lentimonas sp.]|jgi:small-conductance mechanosensitive channel